ncbi:uncharacterized protein LOC127126962 [Lathyrus oleraceus]|uniref:uncharacterized protein LOC127126962 n=1 Tax=Pisum sativum TaxID=3888 RepID=UPI001FC6103C|nr:uncharacterized protein LOC127126962 [Pisum sativum]
MNGNFQNNYRGGWNHIPFIDFAPEQFNYNYGIPHYWGPSNYNYRIPHRIPANFPDIRHLPRQMPAHYLDNRHLPHQMPAHYVDNRHLPHQVPTYYYDPRHLTHQRPQHYANSRHLLPHQRADKRPLLHQRPKNLADKKQIPQQTPECSADKKQIPQQTAEHCADTRCLPHQTVEEYADKTCLLHQTAEDISVKRPLPHQKAENDADNTCLPHRMSEHCADMMNLPQQAPEDHTDRKCLPLRMSELCADMMNLPQQTPEDDTDKKCLPHQMPEPTVPDVATVERVHCKICGVVFPLKNLEAHNNGEKHRRMLIELHEQSTESKTSNGEEGVHIQNSQKNPVVQHKKVPKSKKDGCSVENTSREAPRFGYKEVPAKGSKRKLRDHTGAKDLYFKVENVKNETSSFQKKKVTADKSKRKVRDNTDSEDHRSKREIEEALGGKYMKMSNGIRRSVKNDKPQSTPVELSASAGSNISAKTECISCEPSGQIDSQTELEEGKELLEVQNYGVETNDQPHSISMEIHGLGGSDINTLIEDAYSDFSAIVLVPPQSPIAVQVPTPVDITQTEMLESKVHNEVQNDIVDSNDQQRSISMELHDSAGSMTNNQTEIVNFDSAAIEIVIEPLASALPYAVGSSFESQVSEAVSYIESQHPTEETDIELLSSVLMEIDAPPEVGVETEDGSSQVEVEMDVLADDPAGSDVNALIEDTCSDSGAIVIAPSHSPIASQASAPVAVIQTAMFESKVHNEVQNAIVDSNDQQRLISTELHNPAGSMSNNQTEIVNFDSAAIEIVIEPLASALPNAAGSSFEPMTECGLYTETEPQVSEAVTYIESQPPTEESDIEIDAASEVSVETETEDRGSQAEVDTDVLAGASGRIHLPQVSICLMCGDEGFEEAIVYCSKCGDYAMHRYCLKGPVVFTDDVIWFCEDCEEEILGADYPDSKAADSEKCEVDSIEKCVTFVDPKPIVDPIWRGSLQVFNKSFDKITRLMGHLSTLACPKVLEETRHLPNVLYGDLVQRSAVWPKSFKKFGTDNLSIGLYFFPQNERVVRYYDKLVDEMISNDLAIRVWVEKAELLIFSSRMLPSQYKRFQSKYYLWGIFKRKQEPLV